ncbi:MAG: aminopeptidase P family protein [Bacteroidota bacterium]
MTIPERIAALRAAMQQHHLDAYYVGSADPHQSEYVAEHWQSRQWLSGFDGSAGTLIVTATAAKLWTDSRYFIQAERQLAGTGIDLMKLKVPHTPEYLEWLQDQLSSGQTLGMDGRVVSVATANRIEKAMQDCDVSCNLDHDLLNDIWTDRPALPATQPFAHDPAYVGSSRTEKLDRMRAFLRQKGLAHYLVIGLDEIAWLLNIRATDVEFNPLCLSYLLLRPQGGIWFVNPKRLSPQLKESIKSCGISLADYQDITPELLRIAATNDPLGMDTRLASVSIYYAAGGAQVIKEKSPIALWKALKNQREIDHYHQAMARDGVALLKLRRWLAESGAAARVSEVDISERLQALRAEQTHYQGDSFPAIVGYRGNGAIVHYRAQPETCASIAPDGLLLLDSGGQYLDGTTDITRTFALGKPTEAEKHHFTLVLKGMIDLSMAQFPAGTTGVQLDVLARQHLWSEQLNYGHGTGHGVGYFLNVHEGPMSLSPNPNAAGPRVALQPGMVLSNEPGYYRTGEYGIRIENLVVVVKKAPGWLGFDTLTVFPIERELIAIDLLSPAQIAWINAYHEHVLASINPLLDDPAERTWLLEACREIKLGSND